MCEELYMLAYAADTFVSVGLVGYACRQVIDTLIFVANWLSPSLPPSLAEPVSADAYAREVAANSLPL